MVYSLKFQSSSQNCHLSLITNKINTIITIIKP